METSTPLDRAAERPGWLPWVVLWAGVLAASVSAILIRYATGAQPLAIAFWRCLAGAAVLLPFGAARVRTSRPREVGLAAVAGVFLALHFGTWITSVRLTTVAASVLLVSTTPVFTAIAAWVLFRDRLPLGGWIGITVAMVGTVLVVAGAGSGGRSSMLGNVLAIVGAMTAGGYLMTGAAARKRMSILPYSIVAYAVSAAVLLGAVVAGDVPLSGYAPATWLAIAGTVIGPQLLGHTLINFSLKDIDSTTVAVILLVEPLIAAALAFALFAETPSVLVYPGGAAILAGIYVVAQVRRPPGVVVE